MELNYIINCIMCENCRYFVENICYFDNKIVDLYYKCENFQFNKELQEEWEKCVNENFV